MVGKRMSKHFAARPTVASPSDPVAGGLRLFDAGDLVEAARAFERVLQKQPRHPLALWHLGRTLLKLGQPEKSIACLRPAAELRPQAPEPLFDLCIALTATGRFEDAVRYLT